MIQLTFIIPVYNNAESLALLYSQLRICCENADISAWQILFVNDASKDNSLEIIQTLHKQFPQFIQFVSHSFNVGQVGAIAAGLKATKSDSCFILSADLQEPVSLIENMLVRYRRTSNTIIATRINREESFFRKITSWVFYRSLKWALPQLPVGGFDTFIISGKAKELLTKRLDANRFLQADVLSTAQEFEFIYYTREHRQFGKSQWTFKKKLRYFMLAWIQVFPFLPLLIAGIALLFVLLNYFVFLFSISITVFIYILGALLVTSTLYLRQFKI